MKELVLAPLPYAEDSLAPVISAKDGKVSVESTSNAETPVYVKALVDGHLDWSAASRLFG